MSVCMLCVPDSDTSASLHQCLNTYKSLFGFPSSKLALNLPWEVNSINHKVANNNIIYFIYCISRLFPREPNTPLDYLHLQLRKLGLGGGTVLEGTTLGGKIGNICLFIIFLFHFIPLMWVLKSTDIKCAHIMTHKIKNQVASKYYPKHNTLARV